MRIYADTSFLISLCYPKDAGHPSCRRFFASQPDAEWLTSEWSQFEMTNSLRQLCLKNNGPAPATVEALRRLFKHWHERGNFTFELTDMQTAIQEAGQLSASSGSTIRMRSADVLHVALLEQIEQDLFVTRDKDQYALAISRAFKSRLLA